MADYYVFGDAASGGSGSLLSPWDTFSSLPSLSAGDRVFHRGEIVLPAGTSGLAIGQSGSAAAPIQFLPYNRAAGRTILYATACQRGINVNTDVHHIVLQGLRVTDVGAGSAVSRYGILNNVTGASPTFDASIKILDVEVDNVGSSGAADCNGIFLSGANNKVLDSVVHDIATDGIFYRGHNIEIARTSVYSVSQDGRSAGDCIQAGGAADHGWVHHCYLDHSNEGNKQCYIHNTSSTGLRFEDNECIGYGAAAFTTVLLSSITGAIVQRNLLRGGANAHLSLSCQGGRAVANVVINDYGRGIDLGAIDADAYCNTVVWNGASAAGSGIYGIRHSSASHTGVNAQNNMLYGAWNRGISGTTGSAASHNAFYGCTTNVGGITSGGSDVTADPQLDADYRPCVGSPLLASGADLGPRRDRYRRMGRRFIGAYAAASVQRL